MNPEEWRRIKSVAAAAWQKPPAEQAAIIAALCGVDEALRRQVEGLLRDVAAADDFLEVSALSMPGAAAAIEAAAVALPSLIGARIGSYRVIRALGHGGMGSVYLGERADGEFEQHVAIKLIGGFPTESLLHSFRTERRILASLKHPHIASLLDGGSTADGSPFVIMEYVEGTRIDVYCDERRLQIRQRVELFQRVCEAVHYAHRQQIIHRDIKPNNILVTPDGTPKLLDFGIARIVEPDGAANARTAIPALTPESASPEQARGEPVTIASDVYALGVLLYRLLTGASPYGQTTNEAALLRAIVEVQPRPPSAVARRTGVDDPISRELEAIVLKALRKEPERRYRTVAELTADLKRWLTGHPVLAARDSLGYRGQKFVARHRAMVGVGLAALVTGMLAQWGFVSRKSDAPAAVRSVAVLPFKPLVAHQSDDNYLGAALAEAMIVELRAAQSTIRPVDAATYRNDDPVAAGRKLGVDLVLDGAIQRTADRLHVSVYLVRTADAVTIWSDRFDQAWTDVFTVQDAIANQVTRSLAITLSREDLQRVARRRTANVDAYDAYLRGRYLWNQRTTASLQKALTYFEQAIQRDAEYAAAYAGLADTYALLGSINAAVMPPQEAGERAKQAARKALTLDPTLAEAEVSLAFTLYSFDWDWAAGETHFRRAIELDPNYVAGHYWYSLYLGQVGRFDEQLLESQRALDLEPLSLVGTYAVALAHYNARRFDRARQYAEKALEISPDFPPADRLLVKIHSAEGRYADAVEQCRRLYNRAPHNSMSAALMAHAYGRAGDAAQARRILHGLITQSASTYVSPANVAIGFIGVNDNDSAFAWLEKAYAERSQGLTFLKTDPIFDPLRPDPRFAGLLRRVGLRPLT